MNLKFKYTYFVNVLVIFIKKEYISESRSCKIQIWPYTSQSVHVPISVGFSYNSEISFLREQNGRSLGGDKNHTKIEIIDGSEIQIYRQIVEFYKRYSQMFQQITRYVLKVFIIIILGLENIISHVNCKMMVLWRNWKAIPIQI